MAVRVSLPRIPITSMFQLLPIPHLLATYLVTPSQSVKSNQTSSRYWCRQLCIRPHTETTNFGLIVLNVDENISLVGWWVCGKGKEERGKRSLEGQESLGSRWPAANRVTLSSFSSELYQGDTFDRVFHLFLHELVNCTRMTLWTELWMYCWATVTCWIIEAGSCLVFGTTDSGGKVGLRRHLKTHSGEKSNRFWSKSRLSVTIWVNYLKEMEIRFSTKLPQYPLKDVCHLYQKPFFKRKYSIVLESGV